MTIAKISEDEEWNLYGKEMPRKNFFNSE